MSGQDLAHEFGHFLLLGDDYGWLTFRNHKGHMMSNDLIRNVVQHEVDEVVGDQGCKCKP